MQNLRREPHSSVTVCRFCKLKSCCYVIAIPSDWHCCPNPNCYARFRSKKRLLHASPSRFLHTVSQFCKLKSCCYVIVIPSDWHCCPNPNCYARFRSKNRLLHASPSRFLHTVSQYAQPIRESNPVTAERELSVLTTRPPSSQH